MRLNVYLLTKLDTLQFTHRQLINLAQPRDHVKFRKQSVAFRKRQARQHRAHKVRQMTELRNIGDRDLQFIGEIRCGRNHLLNGLNEVITKRLKFRPENWFLIF